MEFASKNVLFDPHQEQEEIYKDEVEDGIANNADEQAKVWQQEAKENPESSTISADFLRELNQMTNDSKKKRSGAFGTQTRLQPRFQKGKQQQFDKLVNNRVQQEHQMKNDQQKAVFQQIKGLNEEYDKWFEQQQNAPPQPEAQSQPVASVPPPNQVMPLPSTNLTQSKGLSIPLNEIQSAIIDLGTCYIKAGFGGEDMIRSIFPALVGRPRHSGVMVKNNHAKSHSPNFSHLTNNN